MLLDARLWVHPDPVLKAVAPLDDIVFWARRKTFEELIAHYNVIVEDFETDPSLKIEVA